MASLNSLFFSISCFFVLFTSSIRVEAKRTQPIVDGLSWDFYKDSCPKAEKIIRKELKKILKEDIKQAAGLLRLQFHDCFVQGCDASILLDSTANQTSEKLSIPNTTLNPTSFEILNNLSLILQEKCGPVVSCADILIIAARDSVALSGGPKYDVPLGRRDGLIAASNITVLTNVPAPFFTTNQTLASFAQQNLSITDLVTLSGAHTIGRSHCGAFTGRLFPTQDPTMNQCFANDLKLNCPASNSTNFTVNDVRTPNLFDNKYYVDLVNREGLFTSDQDLFTDDRTNPIVTSYATNMKLFFENFVDSIVKMSQIGVLTGSQGEIRTDCSASNTLVDLLSTMVDEEGERLSGF